LGEQGALQSSTAGSSAGAGSSGGAWPPSTMPPGAASASEE